MSLATPLAMTLASLSQLLAIASLWLAMTTIPLVNDTSFPFGIVCRCDIQCDTITRVEAQWEESD